MSLDAAEDGLLEERRTSNFRLKLEKFSFQTRQISPVRRNVRNSNSHENRSAVVKACGSGSKKRTIVTSTDESPTKSKKKRGYAPPDTYAHLSYLTDCLTEYLDVLFCGINPGIHSATVGHHFAHPGNRFYKMLHGSGFTNCLIPPEEDSTLPARYNIGIIDIVDRPSRCEDELSPEEMIESVPTLLQKVARYRPRFVCFIGKGMGRKVEKGFNQAMSNSITAIPAQGTEAKDIWSTGTLNKQRNRRSPMTASGSMAQASTDKEIGLRPYKVTHSDTASPVRETLFFVSHSSSGLATSMNLKEKTDILKELRELVAKHRASTLDTSSFQEVPIISAAARTNDHR